MNNYIIYFIECIFLLLLSVGLSAKTVLDLRDALIFYNDVSNKKTIKTKAVITQLRRSVNSRGCTASARAEYVIHGEQIIGKMICRFDDRLKSEQKINVLVSGTKKDIFAVDDVLYTPEQQVKNAVLTYSVLCFLSLVLVTGVVILSIIIFPKPL